MSFEPIDPRFLKTGTARMHSAKGVLRTFKPVMSGSPALQYLQSMAARILFFRAKPTFPVFPEPPAKY
jgi:hypothetical protein